MKEAICNLCKHFEYGGTGDRFVCKAFPRGIPSAILAEGFDHRNHFPRDFGVLFEPASEQAAQKVKEWETSR